MNSVAGRHLENIDINADGEVLVLSSNLTGQYWNGSLNYFSAGAEVTGDAIHKTHTAKEMYVGVADGAWCDSSHVVVGTDEGEVQILSLEDKFFIDPVEIIVHHSYVTSVATNSEKCVSGGADHHVNIGNVQEQRLIRKYLAHSDIVNQVAIHNSSADMFVSCSMDRNVMMWDTRKSKPAKRISLTSDIVTAVSYNDNLLTLGTERGQLLIKDIRNMDRPLKSLTNHCRAIRRIKFNPHKPDLIATCGDDGNVNVINYSLVNTSTIYTNGDHRDFVTGLVWKAADQFLTCSWDSTIVSHSIRKDHGQGDVITTNGTM